MTTLVGTPDPEPDPKPVLWTQVVSNGTTGGTSIIVRWSGTTGFISPISNTPPQEGNH